MGTDGHDESQRDAVCDAFAALLQAGPEADIHSIASQHDWTHDSRIKLKREPPRCML
jgi:hypothetical protein